ncbi:MAG: EAL domain-containing protein [Gallionella sp.]|nr:EAL domain-containing protein [Gallionella sp.]
MKIVIVEAADWMRKQITARCTGCQNLQFAGLAATESDAANMIFATQPDVVLIDLTVLNGDPANFVKQTHATSEQSVILALSPTEARHSRQAFSNAVSNIKYHQSNDFHLLLACLDNLLALEELHDEQQRLDALKNLGILDTPEEEVFDEITRLAAAIVDAPIALISLVDETRQWFKSHIGIDVRETPRAISFCQYAIKHTDVFVVEDARLDERFKDNPLVTGEPYIRFYAGMPIVLQGGEAIGTLCVVDHQPKQLNKLQKLALQVLTHNITAELEKRAHVVALNDEIARRKEAEVYIMQIATHDRLTNLPNRAALHENLKQAIKLAERGNHGVAFLYIDLDRFKGVNDTLGHNVGDVLLTEVCQRMSAGLRDSDSIARMGGDEFAVVLSDVEALENAQHIAAKIIAAVSEPYIYLQHRINISCSIGIALYPAHGKQVDELIRHADLAMYQAKKQGGGVHQVFLESMQHDVDERMNLEVDLRNALLSQELILQYQPKLASDSEALVGAEALVRWQHPQMGLLGAERFIGVAEETGQIIVLGEYVLNAALAQLAKWDRSGLELPQIAVNVSPQQLCDGFAGIVAKILLQYNIAPQRLELEITETSLTRDAPDMLKVLHELQTLGVRIAVDDFGVGYSSLALLRNLPVNTLKIDRSFVCELGHDTQDAAIIRAIVVMAQALKLRTVAEGVESEEQCLTIKSLGCDMVQGSFYGMPMPPHDFSAWAMHHAK